MMHPWCPQGVKGSLLIFLPDTGQSPGQKLRQSARSSLKGKRSIEGSRAVQWLKCCGFWISSTCMDGRFLKQESWKFVSFPSRDWTKHVFLCGCGASDWKLFIRLAQSNPSCTALGTSIPQTIGLMSNFQGNTWYTLFRDEPWEVWAGFSITDTAGFVWQTDPGAPKRKISYHLKWWVESWGVWKWILAWPGDLGASHPPELVFRLCKILEQ